MTFKLFSCARSATSPKSSLAASLALQPRAGQPEHDFQIPYLWPIMWRPICQWFWAAQQQHGSKSLWFWPWLLSELRQCNLVLPGSGLFWTSTFDGVPAPRISNMTRNVWDRFSSKLTSIWLLLESTALGVELSRHFKFNFGSCASTLKLEMTGINLQVYVH